MNREAAVAALALTGLLCAPGASSAQRVALPDTLATDTSAAAQAEAEARKPPVSAGGAFLRSLVIPGWAQAELGHESRGAFYFLAETFSLFMIARTQIRLDHAERTLPADDDIISSRKQQREDWIALAIFWAFFSAADGWVSVQLYGFDEVTGVRPGETAFSVGWSIPFGP